MTTTTRRIPVDVPPRDETTAARLARSFGGRIDPETGAMLCGCGRPIKWSGYLFACFSCQLVEDAPTAAWEPPEVSE